MKRVLFKIILPLAFIAVWLNMCYWICLGLVSVLDYEWISIWHSKDACTADTSQFWNSREHRNIGTGCNHRRHDRSDCSCNKNCCNHTGRNQYHNGTCRKENFLLNRSRYEMKVFIPAYFVTSGHSVQKWKGMIWNQ